MRGRSRVVTLREVVDGIRATFSELSAVGNALAREWRVTVAMRGVLEHVCMSGPAPVPEIARVKRRTRQSIQEIVDALLAQGFVVLENNPAHGRSRLVAVSASGRRVYQAILKKEDAALDALASRLDIDIEQLALMLRKLEDAVRVHFAAELSEGRHEQSH